MEHEAPEANKKIADVSHLKDSIMSMFSTALNALVCKVNEHQIGQGVDDFGGIVGEVVILEAVSNAGHVVLTRLVYLLTPLQSRSDWIPKARLIWRWVSNRRKPCWHFCGTRTLIEVIDAKSK